MYNRILTAAVAGLMFSALGSSYTQPAGCTTMHVSSAQPHAAADIAEAQSGHADCGSCQGSVDCCCLTTVAPTLDGSVLNDAAPVREWSAAAVRQSVPAVTPIPTTPPPEA